MSFWRHADEEQLGILGEILQLMEQAGATIINGTEITNYETIVSPDGWDWDWGTTRGFPNESEFTVIKVDFYNNINTYLSDVGNTKIKSFADIIQYNIDNVGSEGGKPGVHPAFASGQDNFDASFATNGVKDETYLQALEFTQTSTKTGIDDALNYNSKKLNGLLVPPNVGQSYQIAAQAQYPVITIPAGVHDMMGDKGMGFGLGIIQTAYGEPELIKYASAIEDLQRHSGTPYKRTLPKWRGYRERNIPVPF